MRVWSEYCKSGEKDEWSGQESANGMLVNMLLAVSVSGHAQCKASGFDISLKAFCSLLPPTALKGKSPTGVVQQGSGQGQ